MKKFIYIPIAAIICLFYSTHSFTQHEFAVEAKTFNSTNSSLHKIVLKPVKEVSPPTKKNRVALINAPAEVYFQMDEITIESRYETAMVETKCGYFISCAYGCYRSFERCDVLKDTISKSQVTVFEQETKRELNLKLYPNPMQNESRLEIENYSDEIYSVELYDISGKLIRQESNLSGSVYIFQRNDLPSGIYIWRFVSENNLLKSGRLIAS